MAHRQRDLVRRVLPRIEADLRVRREMDGLHRHDIGVPRHVIRQHQDRRLAVAHEIPGHGVHEVGAGAVHVGQEGVDHRHRQVGPAGAQFRAPALHVVVVGEIGHLRAVAAGLRRHGGDDAVAGAAQQVPDERAADAEAEHHEIADAQMVHQADMVVGIGVPRPAGFERPRRLAALGVAQIGRDNPEFALELVERVERVGREARDRRVQPAAGNDHQREAGAGLFVIDAGVAFFEERHGVSPRLG